MSRQSNFRRRIQSHSASSYHIYMRVHINLSSQHSMLWYLSNRKAKAKSARPRPNHLDPSLAHQAIQASAAAKIQHEAHSEQDEPNGVGSKSGMNGIANNRVSTDLIVPAQHAQLRCEELHAIIVECQEVVNLLAIDNLRGIHHMVVRHHHPPGSFIIIAMLSHHHSLHIEDVVARYRMSRSLWRSRG